VDQYLFREISPFPWIANFFNIVGFRAMGEAGGLLWFAMEYVPGFDAARLMKQQSTQPIKVAVRIICQVLQARNARKSRTAVRLVSTVSALKVVNLNQW
jgi:hypothetical protein